MTAASKPRGPKRTPQESAAFRERLIAAARALFVEEGFEAVSIRRIAQRAGCPPMTFYVFFKSKRELLRHIWEDVFADLFAQCAPAAAGPGDPERRLAALLRAIVAYWLQHPDNYRVVFMHQDRVTAPDEAYYVDSSAIRERFQLIDGLIAEGVAEGVFDAADVEVAAQLVLVNMVGLAHVLITIPEFPWRREALVEQAVRSLLRGLGARPD
ncbi:TetR/AcrR family transcriptional regulator [Phenylobacterium montanum]|uniref:TetR/AcrR family transcriptional regulator n=1 Tax=Phenylobacterium montanum TaxID=2823693 RepID=A0A975ITG3_9CAUL|nr:TetR/AcrR family transcriptional regulator [Caulobacter sp. S6]QUD86837.1 TetR/AcrR family transcriptional regulator [Caulobacter sp. S6]